MIKFNLRNILTLSGLFFMLLYLRRGHQLLYPEVWDEDTYNIISFIHNSWMNLYEPVAGYLITIPKLITNISMSISFLYYPEISTYLTFIFTIFVALAIVYAPTKLKYPVIAAFLVFLIPTDAETYGLPLYTLWFSAILLFLAALWEPNKQLNIKNIFLFMGGLSSPVIVLMIPIQLFRIVVLKNKKQELVSLGLVIFLSMVQVSFILKTGTHTNIPVIDINFLKIIVIKFFAFYYLRDFITSEYILFLGGTYLILIIFIYLYKNKQDIFFYILFYLLISSIILSVARVNPNIIHPIFAGPRYFFFPFIILSWTLLYISAKNKYYMFMIFPIFILSIYLSFQNFGRLHDNLEWRRHIVTCANVTSDYEIPTHYNGDKKFAGTILKGPSQDLELFIRLDTSICKKIIKDDLFKSHISDISSFNIIKSIHFNKEDLTSIPKIYFSNFINNAVCNNKSFKNLDIFGSYIHGDSDLAKIKFQGTKNSSFLIKTGPVTSNQIIKITDKYNTIIKEERLKQSKNWLLYKFNKTLPNEFFVEILDNGTGWGEWSAIAFKKDKNENK